MTTSSQDRADSASAAADRGAGREPALGVDTRRGFFTKLAAILVGLIVALVPLAAGLAVFLDPLRRRQGESPFVRVAPLFAVPPDGVPRRFAVVTQRTDAWNRFPSQPIGAVFLRRTSEDGPVEALTAECPHAGCSINFIAAASDFQCPCHDSKFELDGARIDPHRCPSPRAMDSLATEIRGEGDQAEIWVQFEKFRTGIPQKIAIT